MAEEATVEDENFEDARQELLSSAEDEGDEKAAVPPRPLTGIVTATQMTCGGRDRSSHGKRRKVNPRAECSGSYNEEDDPAWRWSPGDSYSDFEIEIETVLEDGEDSHAVSCDGTTVTTIYHVHRISLISGQLRSEYFTAALRMGGRWADRDRVQIRLDGLSARAFPAFLDHLYAGRTDVKLDPAETIGLLHLADYFRVPLLIENVKTELMDDLDEMVLPEYFRGIVRFQRDDATTTIRYLTMHLVAEAVLQCQNKGTNASQVVERVAAEIDFGLLSDVVKFCGLLVSSRNAFEETMDNGSVSVLVAKFVANHRGNLTAEEIGANYERAESAGDFWECRLAVHGRIRNGHHSYRRFDPAETLHRLAVVESIRTRPRRCEEAGE